VDRAGGVFGGGILGGGEQRSEFRKCWCLSAVEWPLTRIASASPRTRRVPEVRNGEKKSLGREFFSGVTQAYSVSELSQFQGFLTFPTTLSF